MQRFRGKFDKKNTMVCKRSIKINNKKIDAIFIFISLFCQQEKQNQCNAWNKRKQNINGRKENDKNTAKYVSS